MGVALRGVKDKLNRSVQIFLDELFRVTHPWAMDDVRIVRESMYDDMPKKRRQVLEAASDLFMRQGYAAVSMDAVAKAAGVSKATLYAHFASKDRLFAAMVGEACRQNTLVSENFPETVTDMRASLTAIGGRVLRFLLEERTLAVYRVAVAESARFPELGAAFWAAGPQAFLDRFAAWLDVQARAGHITVEDPLVAAEHFGALLRASLFMRATLALPPVPTEAEIDATVAAAVTTLLRALRPV